MAPLWPQAFSFRDARRSRLSEVPEGAAAGARLPGEGFIQTGERSVTSYLVKPMRDQIWREVYLSPPPRPEPLPRRTPEAGRRGRLPPPGA